MFMPLFSFCCFSELDVLICVAGGYVHGSVKESNIFAQLDRMYKFNIQSSVAAAHVACHFLKEVTSSFLSFFLFLRFTL
jgi:NADP-dependent 3-hydroxy acid dehydrogenase YdfG